MTTLLGAHSELVSRTQLFADNNAAAGDAAAVPLSSGTAAAAEAAVKTFDDTVSNWANFDVESVAAITGLRFTTASSVVSGVGDARQRVYRLAGCSARQPLCRTLARPRQ